jgi:hypothetical protein
MQGSVLCNIPNLPQTLTARAPSFHRTSMHYELMNQAHDAVLQSKTLFTLDRILEDELKRSPGTCIGLLLIKVDKSLAFSLSSKLQPPSLTLLS